MVEGIQSFRLNLLTVAIVMKGRMNATFNDP